MPSQAQRRARKQLAARLQENYGCETDISPIRANQRALDETVKAFEAATLVANELPESELWRDSLMGRIPHEAIRLRDGYRDQVFHMTSRLIQLGIADRAVQVEEAKASLLAQAVRDAARDAGLSQSQVAALGAALRARLEGAKPPVAKAKQIAPPQRMAGTERSGRVAA